MALYPPCFQTYSGYRAFISFYRKGNTLPSLPILRIGEAIIVGESVHLPIRTLIDPPAANRSPDSSDTLVYGSGAKGPGGRNRLKEKSDYKEMVSIWRKQESSSPRIVEDTDDAIEESAQMIKPKEEYE